MTIAIASSRFTALLALAACLALASGCTNTRVVNQWHDPQVPTPTFARIFVVVPDPAAADRRSAEDALAAALAPTATVVSYRTLPEAADIADRARIIAAAKTAEADGVMVMRLVSDDTVVVYEGGPGPWPGPRPGYYHHPYTGYRPGYHYGPGPFGWGPAYIDTRHIVTLETSAYRVSDGVLAWTVVTRTGEPSDPAQLVRDTVTTLRELWAKH